MNRKRTAECITCEEGRDGSAISAWLHAALYPPEAKDRAGDRVRWNPGGTPEAFVKSGRGDWIRTSDPLRPRQVRYQAALRPDV